MPNQYSKITKAKIEAKINRKRNPVKSVLQLAQEFGVNTAFVRHAKWDNREGRVDHAAPRNFREHVKRQIGVKAYNELRVSKAVNYMYQ